MQISEFTFPHLHEAHEQRLTVELERRRAAAERRAQTNGAPAVRTGSSRRGILARLRSTQWPTPPTAQNRMEPCADCP